MVHLEVVMTLEEYIRIKKDADWEGQTVAAWLVTKVLDEALFGNVQNMQYPDNILITFEGDYFVVGDWDKVEELHHFKVSIEPCEWDSKQVLIDQEWYDNGPAD